MIKYIQLTKGKQTIVDSVNYDYLSQWKWHAKQSESGKWYAARTSKGSTVRMHRQILGLELGEIGDHINGNGLDNRLANLRACKNRENNWNRRKWKLKSGKYKGTSWYKRYSKWIAQISYKSTQYNLGYYDNEEDAAIAYDVAAQLMFGEFSKLNFPNHINQFPPKK